ncbi:helix-turn-helix domain-containing protein [Nocardia farcinica]
MTIASTYSQRVAAEIRAEMARKGKTIAALAEVIGRTEPTARSRYHGRSPFNFDELMAVCRWLGVTLAQLHHGEETSNAS